MDISKRYSNFKSNYSKDFKSFIRSILALLMAVMLVLGSTFAWIEGSKKAEANGNECTVSAGAGLQFMGAGVVNGVLTLDDSTTLEDCSSVDGRNIFFPTTGSIQSSTTGTVASTSDLKFRSAVESDKNVKYLTKDFIIKSLESKSASGSTEQTTKIYIDSASYFTGSDGIDLKPFRISLNFNDGTSPKVICPGLSKDTEKRSYSPVCSISDDGEPNTENKTALQHGYYYYGKTPVYQLPHGESRRVTVTVWLEGSDEACSTAVAAKNLDMNLILSTEESNMRTVTFVDYSPKQWVKEDGATMYVVDNTNTASTWVMSSSDNKTYTAKIPKRVKNIYFQRTTESDKSLGIQNDQNSWSVGDTDNLASSSTYYAIGRGSGYDTVNSGYWVDSSCTGVLTIYYHDTNATIQSSGQNYPRIYIYNSTLYGIGDSKILCDKGWPGFQMDKLGGKSFAITIPAENGIQYIINDGKGEDEGSKRKSGTLSDLDQNSNSYIDVDY